MPYRLRPHIREMAPYSPGKPVEEVQRELGLKSVVKLASNENPFGPSPRALEAVRLAAASMNVYPDASGRRLRDALAVRYGLKSDQVVLGNGSDGLIHNLGLVFLGSPDDEVVVGDPSFVRYDASAHLAPCRLVKVPLDRQWRHELKAMAAALSDRTKLVYIANPNNPTGTIVPETEVRALIRDLPPGCPLVLDEAYFEFAADVPGYPDGARLLSEGLPVVVLRTFSKAYGLAGLRVGYGFADAEIVDSIDRVREPFDVSALAQEGALAALDDSAHVADSVRRNREGLRLIADSAVEAGFGVVESHANFVCIDLGRPCRPVFEALLRLGVIVRPCDIFGMPNHIRVSVGTEAETQVYLEAFQRVVLASQEVPA
ncbi:MAG: histidinol-phosphate transaminase [Fimbriimonadaceae bacterium]|nr:histidinol-phosphate transaminase [Fimbriimonadaceae bacterium]QYK57491.1 MAG: histidinol-phosphate transaminase [Fimbriimonadaceae bacterium]